MADNPGKIIIINGTSSSGKTSILEGIQKHFEEPYLNAGIDKFIWMLPERYLDRPLWDDVLGLAISAGAMGHRLFSGMHHAIYHLAKSGLNIVADHVMVEECWVQECAQLFAGLPAYLIGVHCPLEVLEKREKARKNRTLGQAKAQFPIVHRHLIYDFEVDTSKHSPKECVALIEAHINRQAPVALKKLHEKFMA